MLAAGPELRITGAAAQTRMVSVAGIRLDSRKSVRHFKGIIPDDISQFESHMPSHAVGLSASLLVSAGGVFGPAMPDRWFGCRRGSLESGDETHANIASEQAKEE